MKNLIKYKAGHPFKLQVFIRIIYSLFTVKMDAYLGSPKVSELKSCMYFWLYSYGER